MYFTIRNFNFKDMDTNKGIYLSDFKTVESGLSYGEVRQSLLDRLKEELRRGNMKSLNSCLGDFGFSIKEDFVNDKASRDIVLTDIDDVLYNIVDEDLNGKVWYFSEEIIEITGEEE